MVSHELSLRMSDPGAALRISDQGGSVRRDPAGVTIPADLRCAWGAGHGPLRVERHVAARLQGTRIDPRFISLGARPRRLCRPLLLSGVGSPRDRRRRECADGGDRGVDRAIHAVLGGAGATVARALWHQRDAEGRRRGTRCAEREFEAPCGDRGRGDVRRSGSQVSDLGARPVPERARGGHPKGARAQGRTGFSDGGTRRPRSTGMTAGGGSSAVAGGPALHIPVLGTPALALLNVHDGGVYIDGTFGAGGYSRAILQAANSKVIGIDRDPAALALGAGLVAEAGGRLTLVEDRFSNLAAAARDCGFEQVDGIVLDVGVSSMQLDQAERGFSFRNDGPLDMRMSGEGASAADVVNA